MKDRALLQSLFAKYYRENPEAIQEPPRIESREFGFLLFQGKVMVRHRKFSTVGELRDFMARVGPSDAYRSAAYYQRPDASMDEKGWLGADLAFDIDADHLETACRKEHDSWRCLKCGYVGRGKAPEKCPKCGGAKFKESTWPCDICLSTAKDEVIKLIEILEDDFGFATDKMHVYFSGHRGYHLILEDEEVRSLGQEERREIVDYVMAVGLTPELHGFTKTSTRMPSFDSPGWRGRIIRGIYEVVHLATTPEGRRELKAAGIRGRALSVLEKEGENIIKMLENEEILKLPRGIGEKTWKKLLLRGAKRRAAEVDPVVTIDVHRLMRLEGSLHGKTGLRKVEVPLTRLEAFDPLKEAVAFNRGELRVKILVDTPKFHIGHDELGPYKAGKTETLPLAASVLLVCKGFAEVQEG